MNLFLASSTVELVSACIARRHLGEAPAVLLFNLAHNRETEAARSRVLEFGDFWDRVVFLEPQEAPGMGDLRLNALHRLRRELRDSGRYVAALNRLLGQCLDGEALRQKGRGTKVFFNHFHHHVFYVLGLLPEAARVYYPHGLDQPRRSQLASSPFLFSPRGWSTLVTTWRYQGTMRRSLYVVRLWLAAQRKARIPFPFDGVDQALVYSPARPEAPFERIAPELVCATLKEIAGRQQIRAALAGAFEGLRADRTALLLLPELDTQHTNTKYLEAMEALMDSILKRETVEAFVLKPHPRSSHAGYESFFMRLRARRPQSQIVAWPREAFGLTTELVAAALPLRCAGSIGSCALPPWASSGVPHYVSRKAAELFDRGWPEPSLLGRVYPSYTVFIADLALEQTAMVLD